MALLLTDELLELESETFEVIDVSELSEEMAGSTSCCSCSTSSCCSCSCSCGSTTSTTSCSSGSTSSCA